ncbi:MAG: exodeoxyribonuclease III [Ponticaulis sp.]|nr:exodeoxyribonuclease III [Ponticaulis sp.]
MKIATWNVNSVKARLPTVLEVLKTIDCDVICLQELKCETDAFPYMEIEDLGYEAAVHGQKTYNGVAILSKTNIEDVVKGLPGNEDDEQSRYIEVTTGGETPVRVASIYLPNGNPFPGEKFDYKLSWMKYLEARASDLLKLEEPVILAGDYNVIPSDDDCWDPSVWANDALAQPESRAAFQRLQWLGYTESFASIEAKSHAYTFWDYQRGAWQKDHGIRIDHLLLSPEAGDRLEKVEIFKAARGLEKPSDHVPVIGHLKLT